MWFVSNGISFLQPSIYLLRLFRHEDGSVYIFMDLESKKASTTVVPSSKRKAGGTGLPRFKPTRDSGVGPSSAVGPSPKHQKVTQKSVSETQELLSPDPLGGIPEVVRRNIPPKTAESARNSDGKFYSSIVSTCRSSSDSSIVFPRDSKPMVFPVEKHDPQKAINAELDQIPSSGHYTSRDRVKVMGLMPNDIPLDMPKLSPRRMKPN
ncbi:uncharacterized protein [Spinacia oleracea]|uniref:Uncharacterized protein isoform X1 n=1 Tax=Spinacia oleracea TaxID=3562 RepID=A0ABM3QKV3_SPIOL|nr:uncharacterized protein LOC110776954 isoform X1 [Spinacia oleracea]XP_056683989.1 uncharacterized protein LOC110776954 isoform X1 [Spinacia oleracea]